MMTRKLILDLDTGIDDTLAIAYALGGSDAEVIGITGTYGNVTVEQGMDNSLAVLDLFGHPEIPVYPGISHPTGSDDFTPSEGSTRIHGHDGVGEAHLVSSPRSPERTSAVDFMLDAASTYGENLDIVATGAMTTLAEVIRREPRLDKAIGSITLMAGALTVPGNVSPGAEANISQDPEAADAIFRSGVHTTMIGLDVTHQCVLTKHETMRWRASGTPAGVFLADMTDYYIDAYLTDQPELGGCGLHDPLAVAAALDPKLVSTLGVNLQVDLAGPFRGRTIGDRSRLTDPDKTTQVAIGVRREEFVRRLMTRIGALVCADQQCPRCDSNARHPL